jgi:hypothetical protein
MVNGWGRQGSVKKRVRADALKSGGGEAKQLLQALLVDHFECVRFNVHMAAYPVDEVMIASGRRWLCRLGLARC